MKAEAARVARVRLLLGEVTQQHLIELRKSIDASLDEALHIRIDEARAHAARPMPYPYRRRLLLGEIKHKARGYGMEDEVTLYALRAGQETILSLDNAHLEALNRWLDRAIDRLQLACDSPYAAPAR